MAQAGSLRIKDIEAFKSPKEGKPRVDYLDLDEEQEFWDLAIAYSTGKPLTPRTRFICLGLDAGARAEAICDLTWDRVGRGKGCRANVDMLEFQLPGAIETKKRRATVPISERLAPVLEQARAQAWDEALAQAGGSVAKAEKVLMGMKVVGISAASLCSSWRDWPPVMKPSRSGTGKGKALRRSRTGKFAHITPHILRHTFGTLRAQAGFSVFKLAALMGDTVATIEKNYLKHAPHLYADAVNLPARVIKAKVEEADA
jgi:integrase